MTSAKEECRLYIPSQIAINECDRLSADCVNSSNVNYLKTKST